MNILFYIAYYYVNNMILEKVKTFLKQNNIIIFLKMK